MSRERKTTADTERADREARNRARTHGGYAVRVEAPIPKKSHKRMSSGKKVVAWGKKRAELKKRFAAVSLPISCEFVGLLDHECWGKKDWSFAHSRKRTDPLYNEEEVAVACPHAHQILDEKLQSKGHDEMYRKVMEAIQRRSVQP